jgi:WhiB family redox-sensing transcriptional regulator
MQWPDATASAATAGAGFVAGAAGDGRPVASPAAPVPRQQREHTGSQIAASGVPGGMDLPCTDDPDLFFAEAPEDVERAKAICRGCRARIACLTGALERREPWGVWGGELLLHGAIMPHKRPRGRPRKAPRADVAA